MKPSTLLKILLLVVTFGTVPAYSAPSGVDVTYHEVLDDFEFHQVVASGDSNVGQSAPAQVVFSALGRQFQLELEPNAKLLPALRELNSQDDIQVFSGKIAGDEDSWVRLVVSDGVPQGLLWDGRDLIAIEAPMDSAVDSDAPVVFRLADMEIAPDAMSCGASPNGSATYGSLVQELRANLQGPGASSEITLGVVGDFEFSESFGADANLALITRFNNVDGIFSEQVGIQVRVDEISVFTDAGDPFSDTLDASDLLNELGVYRNNNPSQSATGLTHMYTAKNLDGTTVGIAFLGTLCSARFGVGLSEARRGATTDSLIAAHEIGHNFGAPHDGDPGACSAEPQNMLMAPSINGSDQFSQCSIAEMQPEISSASCIAPLPDVDVGIALDTPAAALLGLDRTITFDVTNSGSAGATNVGIEVTIPANSSLDSISATAGNCSSGAGTASCLLGDIPAGASRSVTVVLDATSIGNADLTVDIAVDVDRNLSNNSGNVTFTVDPAVDLVIDAIPATSVTQNQTATIELGIENLATIGASDVTVTVALGPGLSASSGEFPLGTCTVATDSIECQTANFNGQSISTVTVGLTGDAVGNQTFTVSIASSEPDIAPGNNDVSGTVTVNAPAATGGGGGGGGGGGSVSLLMTLLMLITWGFAFVRRTRKVRPIPYS